MDRNEHRHTTAQLQQCGADQRQSKRDRKLRNAAEAHHHRQRLMKGDSVRLQDLAVEWIELLRASRGKIDD